MPTSVPTETEAMELQTLINSLQIQVTDCQNQIQNLLTTASTNPSAKAAEVSQLNNLVNSMQQEIANLKTELAASHEQVEPITIETPPPNSGNEEPDESAEEVVIETPAIQTPDTNPEDTPKDAPASDASTKRGFLRRLMLG
jgi:chromosome segregation ATPase